METDVKTATIFCLQKFKLGPEEAEIARLIRQHQYYRDCKAPALEKQFDWIKRRVEPRQDGVDPWLLKEYGDISLSLEELRCEMAYIEARAAELAGLTVK